MLRANSAIRKSASLLSAFDMRDVAGQISHVRRSARYPMDDKDWMVSHAGRAERRSGCVGLPKQIVH